MSICITKRGFPVKLTKEWKYLLEFNSTSKCIMGLLRRFEYSLKCCLMVLEERFDQQKSHLMKTTKAFLLIIYLFTKENLNYAVVLIMFTRPNDSFAHRY